MEELFNLALETGFLEMGLVALGAPAGLVFGVKMFKRMKKWSKLGTSNIENSVVIAVVETRWT